MLLSIDLVDTIMVATIAMVAIIVYRVVSPCDPA